MTILRERLSKKLFRNSRVLGLALFFPLLAQDNAPNFALADSREVRDLLRDAEQHFSQSRWTAGLSRLQQILDQYPNDLLPSAEQSRIFLGAGEEAENRLRNLPTEARRNYQSNYGASAASIFEEARRNRDRRRLEQLSARFAFTDSGKDAFLLLGDLALEEGNWKEAEILYRRLSQYFPSSEQESRRQIRLRAIRSVPGWNAQQISEKGFRATDSNSLPSEPTGLDQVAWKLSRAEQLFQHPFTPDFGIPEPTFNLHAGLEKEAVFLSDSISVFGFDLYSGVEKWRFPGAVGWETTANRDRDFFGSGINPHVAVAPAISQNIVIFPLQVPLKLHENETYQGIPIRTIIPARRLFALESSEGKMLWNHWRPALSRLGHGEFTDEANVAAPPLIVGERVFAPFYRMEGKIDYYLACFDLRSGKLIWKTPIVTGQLELNMFGRPIREFAGSPLLYHDGNIYASTNLGVLFKADSLSGRISWISQYESIAIPPATSYQRNPRACYWANQPPVANEGNIFFTPLDSEYLYALDSRSGEALSWLHYDKPHRFGLRHMLGAHDSKLFLYGNSLVAMATREGLGTPRFSLLPTWRRALLPSEITKSSLLPRGAMSEQSLLIPTLEGIRSFSLNDSSEWREIIPWQALGRDLGNLQIEDGFAFVFSDRNVEMRFDWDSLLQKNRRLAASGDVQAKERLGRLLRRRGDSFAKASRPDRDAAISHYLEAGQILGSLYQAGNLSLVQEIFDLEFSLSEIENERGQSISSLLHLRKAKELAPTPNTRLKIGLRLCSFYESQSNDTEFEAELRSVQREFSNENMPEEENEIPVGFYVQSKLYQIQKRRHDFVPALETLHEILSRYPSYRIEGMNAFEYSKNQIEMLLKENGRELYSPYEGKATTLFEKGVEEKDRQKLSELIRLFPNSQAATRAQRSLLDLSLESGELATVASICRDIFRQEKDPVLYSSALRRLTAAFDKNGNLSLAKSLRAKLARDFASIVSDYPPDQSKKFSSLGEERTLTPPLIGPRAPLSPQREVLIANQSIRLLQSTGENAFASGYVFAVCDGELRLYRPLESGMEKPLWYRKLDPEDLRFPAVSLCNNTVVFASSDTLLGLDLHTGEKKWARVLPSPIFEFFAKDGVLVTITQEKEGNFRVEVADAVGGIPIWFHEFSGEEIPRTVLGEGKLAFLPTRGFPRDANDSLGEAMIFDLFTGTLLAEIQFSAFREILSGAIYQNQLLCLVAPGANRDSQTPEKRFTIWGFSIEGEARPWKFELPVQYSNGYFHFAKDQVYLLALTGEPRSDGLAIYRIQAKEGSLYAMQQFPSESQLPDLHPFSTDPGQVADFLILNPEGKGHLRVIHFDLESAQTKWKRNLPVPGWVSFPPALSGHPELLSPVWTDELLLLPLKRRNTQGDREEIEVYVLNRASSETVSSTFSLGEASSRTTPEIVLLPGTLLVQQDLRWRLFSGPER